MKMGLDSLSVELMKTDLVIFCAMKVNSSESTTGLDDDELEVDGHSPTLKKSTGNFLDEGTLMRHFFSFRLGTLKSLLSRRCPTFFVLSITTFLFYKIGIRIHTWPTNKIHSSSCHYINNEFQSRRSGGT